MLSLPDTVNLPAITCYRPERNGADGSVQPGAIAGAGQYANLSYCRHRHKHSATKNDGTKLTALRCFCYPGADLGPESDNKKMSDQEALRQELAELKLEHRDLDDVIARLTERAPYDQLQLQRLKKRKLILKDQIAQVEAELYPDIIA